LAVVRNVGAQAIDAIVRAREEGGSFKSFIDFCQRIDINFINKRAVESLIKCGAFDSLGIYRAQLLAIYERIIDGVHQDKKRNIDGQFSIFQALPSEDKGNLEEDNLPNIKEFPEKILLAMEKEMIGIYISGHPLSEYEHELKSGSSITSSEIYEITNNAENESGNSILGDGSKVLLGGIIIKKQNKITKNNNMMAFATLEDLYGTVELIIFPATYEKYAKHLYEDSIVTVDGRLSINEEEEPKIICESIRPLKKISKEKLYIKMSKDKPINMLDQVKRILSQHTGNIPVYVYIEETKKTVMAERDYWIDISNKELMEKLTGILGKDCVKVC